MSEELKELLAPLAAESERTEQQPKEQQTEIATPEDDADKPETGETDQTEGEDDEDDKGEDDRPRKKSRSERLRRQNERLRAELDAIKSVSAPKAVEDASALEAVVKARIGEPPKEADFEDWFDWQAAKAGYEADKRLVSRQIKEQAQGAQAAQIERIRDLADDYQDNVKAAAKAVPDLVDVLTKATFKPNQTVEMLILEAGEKAPLVAYHLAQNPKAAERLNAMSPVEAAREIGRIEGRVSIPKPKSATSASPPMSTPKGSAAPSSDEAKMNSWLKKTYGG
jgi:hypothetical protein